MYRELIKKIMNGLQVFEQNFLDTTTAVFPIELVYHRLAFL